MLAIDLDHIDEPLKHPRRVTEEGGVLNIPPEEEFPGMWNLQVELSTRYGSAQVRGAQVPQLVSEQLVPPFSCQPQGRPILDNRDGPPAGPVQGLGYVNRRQAVGCHTLLFGALIGYGPKPGRPGLAGGGAACSRV